MMTGEGLLIGRGIGCVVFVRAEQRVARLGMRLLHGLRLWIAGWRAELVSVSGQVGRLVAF